MLPKTNYIKDYLKKKEREKERGERKSMPEAAEWCPGELDYISFAIDLLYNNKQEKSLIILLVF